MNRYEIPKTDSYKYRGRVVTDIAIKAANLASLTEQS